jgi:hypothetical protein
MSNNFLKNIILMYLKYICWTIIICFSVSLDYMIDQVGFDQITF